ncbi:MAG: ABC transporter ATP-binding protein [Proteobacteria bacterium]|jgi:ABC-type branched-subunit amino acid transport system ATPase component|nr:ABC transporter ATP-binding protein [Pseudomonadota bacterium]
MVLLEIKSIYSGYGDMEILHGVSMELHHDEIVTIIGPNASGKSTLLKTIMGYLIPTKGKIRFNGADVTHLRPDEKARVGIGYVPQLENVFPPLTVTESLDMGAYTMPRHGLKERIEEIFDLFPVLRVKRKEKASALSGGQRQMLAMAQALMTGPNLLLLDEPSAGLAPNTRIDVFKKIQEIHHMGSAIIIVEQDAYQSLRISNRCYILVMGQKEHEAPADRILEDERIKKAYLGG